MREETTFEEMVDLKVELVAEAAKAAEESSDVCGVASPFEDITSGPYFCTLPDGHDGDHEAWAADGRLLKEWSDA